MCSPWTGLTLLCRWGSAGSVTLNIATVRWGKMYYGFIAGFGNCCQSCHQLCPSVLSFISLLVPITLAWKLQHGCDPQGKWADLPWAGWQPRSVCSFSRKAVLWWLCFLSMEECRRVVIQWKEITVPWLTPCLRELGGSAWEKEAGDFLPLYNYWKESCSQERVDLFYQVVNDRMRWNGWNGFKLCQGRVKLRIRKKIVWVDSIQPRIMVESPSLQVWENPL